jgi:hypothetical protein
MGAYVEKLLRLIVCEELSKVAPGVDYNASMIVDLKIIDPWRIQSGYKVPAVHLTLIKVKKQSGSIIDAWDARITA